MFVFAKEQDYQNFQKTMHETDAAGTAGLCHCFGNGDVHIGFFRQPNEMDFAAVLVQPEDEIMLITTGGVLIRTRVAEIREMGRATQGVTLIAVEDGTKLSGLQRVVETDLEEVELEQPPE